MNETAVYEPLLFSRETIFSLSALDDEIQKALPVAQAAYTYMHRNPELGHAEYKAHAYVSEQISALGRFSIFPSQSAPTAVIAVYDTGRPGPVIAIRAELDARPLDPGVVEPHDHNPRSEIDGLMHNCGHDAHTAMLLAMARVVHAQPHWFAGRIVLVFQPAEEIGRGADDLIQEGIIARLGVEQAFALHVSPPLQLGIVSIASGPRLAGSNYFRLVIEGRGSHAAAPYAGDDIPSLAARLVEALTTLPARRLDLANRPMVLSVTSLKADSGASNTLPGSAELVGTIRAFEDLRVAPPGERSLEAIITDTIVSVLHGVSYEWSLRQATPSMRNDEELFSRIVPPLQLIWPGALDVRSRRGMFADDFAYYTQVLPALYFGLGVAKDEFGRSGEHTADFNIHPDSLASGIRLMTLLAHLATNAEKGA
ncbi:M20 family metallopeptidase [Aquabacter sp. CN5-332]|uniref:M20 metallopeptidase family protein n=1 Tax=Aquabacter sp. CN5-332 TaxID=3156608 RepID=UPI0032B5E71F